MPWSTPTLKDVRGLVRDYIRGTLPGADATIPNSVLRVMSDVQGALAHLTLQFIDWLAKQLLPDTAETEWLDRHGDIWLKSIDGSIGRKLATLATGTVQFTGSMGVAIPFGQQLTSSLGVGYETTEQIYLGSGPTPAATRALDAGVDSNLDAQTVLALVDPPANADGNATVIQMDGGTDDETDDELRVRVLRRIQQPPMGGDKQDYENWTLSIPGVTRAWCAPVEMGPGTVTVRFMMDDLRADNNGFPLAGDCQFVKSQLDLVRPVAVKDLFVVAPIPMPVDMKISNLDPNTTAMTNAIEVSLLAIFKERAAPGQIFYRAWIDEGISEAGTNWYDLDCTDAVPDNNGLLPILGTINYVPFPS